MLVAVDTNILGYAEGSDDLHKAVIARRWLTGLDGRVVMPAQVAGELYNVLTRKLGHSPHAAVAAVSAWRTATIFTAPSVASFDMALSLAAEHRMQIWDALITVISVEAGCALLLSEDMQDGFVYRGLTIANPFTETPHPLLASLQEHLS